MHTTLEEIDGELYFEIVLNEKEMTKLDGYNMVTKEIKIFNRRINLAVMVEKEREHHAFE